MSRNEKLLKQLIDEASPLPWSEGQASDHGPHGRESGEYPQVWPAVGALICNFGPDHRPGVPERNYADAALIVRAVNNIAPLKEALVDCLHRLGNMWGMVEPDSSKWGPAKEIARQALKDPTTTLPPGMNYSLVLNFMAYLRAEAAIAALEGYPNDR
jgi:hypothetical protein